MSLFVVSFSQGFVIPVGREICALRVFIATGFITDFRLFQWIELENIILKDKLHLNNNNNNTNTSTNNYYDV